MENDLASVYQIAREKRVYYVAQADIQLRLLLGSELLQVIPVSSTVVVHQGAHLVAFA
jgi:hypothetical protein